MLNHKTSLSKFKKIEIISSIHSNYNTMALEIDHKEKTGNKHNHMDGEGVCARLLQSCPLFATSMHHSPPGSSVHRVLQVRLVEWVAMHFSSDPPKPGIEPASLMSTCFDRWWFFTTSTT